MVTRAAESRLTAEEKQLRTKKQKDAEQKRLKVVGDMNRTFATPSGIASLRVIMELCGYQRTSIVGDPTTGDIHERATIYNEAQRNIYLRLRRMIRPTILQKVEL